METSEDYFQTFDHEEETVMGLEQYWKASFPSGPSK